MLTPNSVNVDNFALWFYVDGCHKSYKLTHKALLPINGDRRHRSRAVLLPMAPLLALLLIPPVQMVARLSVRTTSPAAALLAGLPPGRLPGLIPLNPGQIVC